MTLEEMKKALQLVSKKYGIRKAVLFGSRASGKERQNSDVDLIIEFQGDVSLLQIATLRCELEEQWGLPVDIIHGPLQPGDLIEVDAEVELYAA